MKYYLEIRHKSPGARWMFMSWGTSKRKMTKEMDNYKYHPWSRGEDEFRLVAVADGDKYVEGASP